MIEIIGWIVTILSFSILLGMAGGALVGRECKLYYNAGSFASPTWTEVTRAIDVTLPVDAEYGDVSSRASIFKMQAKSQVVVGPLSFGYRYRQGVTDAVFDALRPMILSTTKTEFAVCDGAIATTGNEYLRGTYQLKGTLDQPLSDGVRVDFEGTLTSEEDAGVLREPQWVTV